MLTQQPHEVMREGEVEPEASLIEKQRAKGRENSRGGVFDVKLMIVRDHGYLDKS